MAGTTRPRPDRRPGPALLRFDRVERAVHGVNAALFAVLLFTGAAMYLEPLSAAIGRRHLIEQIHVYCGIALPVPVLVAVVGHWGRGLRGDLRRLNRWTDDDRAWMRAVGTQRDARMLTRRQLTTGKFNAGQKLNTAFIGGVILVMLGTGLIMRWYHPWPLSFRTGATFVHDWLTFFVAVVIFGHIVYALRDPDALRSIWRGTISRRWAARHAPGWLAEVEPDEAGADPTVPEA